jgi:peptide/nickel transport system substrate-binding protein
MQTNYWQQRISRRRALRGAAVGGAGLAGAAFLAACGGSSGGDTSKSTETGPPASLGQPKTGGNIRIWTNSVPDNAGLDSYLNWSGAMSNYTSFLYPKLTKLKVGPNIGPHQIIPEPDLAKSIEQPDPTTFIFKLHENAKWQDVAPLNGRKVTAEDVVWNLKLWNQKGQNRSLIAPWIERMEAVDQTTVKLSLKKPLYAFQLYVGHTGGPFIMPPELKENDQTREKTASAGAWIMDRYEVGSAVYFKRNPNYYKSPLPYADSVTYSTIRDLSTVSANVRAGNLDLSLFSGYVPFQDVDKLKPALPGYTWLESALGNVSGYTFDLADTKFGLKDERVRQAISLSIDREGFTAVSGPFEAYNSPFHNYEFWYLDPKKDSVLMPYYKRDVQKAKQLLSAAGFAGGIKDLPYMYNVAQTTGFGTELAGQFVQSSLREAGIQVVLTGLQQAEYFQKAQFGNAPNAMTTGVGHFNTDPDEALSLVFDPNSARSPVTNKQIMGEDTKLMDLMDKIKFELDKNKRKGYVDDVQRHLSQKMYVVGSVQTINYHIASKRIKNMNWVMHYAYGPIVAETWIDES